SICSMRSIIPRSGSKEGISCTAPPTKTDSRTQPYANAEVRSGHRQAPSPATKGPLRYSSPMSHHPGPCLGQSPGLYQNWPKKTKGNSKKLYPAKNTLKHSHFCNPEKQEFRHDTTVLRNIH